MEKEREGGRRELETGKRGRNEKKERGREGGKEIF